MGATVFLPDAWVQSTGATRATLSVTARNLYTWTDYSGIDPEVNQGGQANFVSRDFLTHPPVRTWVVRMDMIF